MKNKTVEMTIDDLATLQRLIEVNRSWRGVQGYVYHGVSQTNQEQCLKVIQKYVDNAIKN